MYSFIVRTNNLRRSFEHIEKEETVEKGIMTQNAKSLSDKPNM